MLRNLVISANQTRKEGNLPPGTAEKYGRVLFLKNEFYKLKIVVIANMGNERLQILEDIGIV